MDITQVPAKMATTFGPVRNANRANFTGCTVLGGRTTGSYLA